jgi:hypothetical protein
VPGPWTNKAEVLQDLADTLQVADPAALEPRWVRLVEDAIPDAYRDILAVLVGRGYTPAQLDAWDSRQAVSRDQTRYVALTRGGGLGEYGDRVIEKFNRLKWLQTATLLDDAGNPIIPGGGGIDEDQDDDGIPDTFGGASIGGGRLDQTHWSISGKTQF